MHVAKQESVEVLVDFGGFVSFGYEGCMQFTCHGDEILIPSARYVETVQLACDDTILAVWRQDGLWVWEFVDLQAFCHQLFLGLRVRVRVSRRGSG